MHSLCCLQNHEGMQNWLSRLDSFFQQTAKSLILLAPELERRVREAICQSMAQACQAKAAVGGVDAVTLDHLACALERAIEADVGGHSLQMKLCKAMDRVAIYKDKAEQFSVEGNQNTAFAFVEADFVDAVRLGHWVLLDNVNSAPPEVIERINSLLEEEPTLNIHEHSGGNMSGVWQS